MSELQSDSLRTSNHIYTVELRFSGDMLEPPVITQQLNLQPTNSSDNAASNNLRGRKTRAFWAYNGYGGDGFKAEWESLDQGLKFLLRQLFPLREKVVELSQTFDGIWWCGHFQASFDGGPILSPTVLAELAGYGLPLYIDNYFSSN